jgi:hypothetical protein
MIAPLKQKDPASILDYVFDWSTYLGTDTISTSSWSVTPSGLTITSPAATNTTTTATVWASSGTVGVIYILTNHITTAGGRTEERSFEIQVVNQ